MPSRPPQAPERPESTFAPPPGDLHLTSPVPALPAPVARPPAQPAAPARAGRLETLDATRGLAMLFVCLSHMAEAVFFMTGKSLLLGLAIAVSMIASPTFMLISGMVLGVVATRGLADFDRFSGKLRERGVFLLTIGHLLMLPAHLPMMDVPSQVWRFLLMTDAIGVALLVAPSVVRRMSPRARMLLAVAVLALDWVMIYATRDLEGHWPRLVATTLFGAFDPAKSFWVFSFALVPWFSVYLVGTVLGERLATFGRDAAAAARRIAIWGAVAFAVFVVMNLLPRAVAAVTAETTGLELVLAKISHFHQKRPPAPGYFLAYGGAGLWMLAVMYRAMEWRWLRPVTERLTEIGQASLFIFILQYYLYYTVVPAIGRRVAPVWIAAYLASLAVIVAGARLWLRVDGNRWLRVPGYQRLFGPRRPVVMP